MGHQTRRLPRLRPRRGPESRQHAPADLLVRYDVDPRQITSEEQFTQRVEQVVKFWRSLKLQRKYLALATALLTADTGLRRNKQLTLRPSSLTARVPRTGRRQVQPAYRRAGRGPVCDRARRPPAGRDARRHVPRGGRPERTGGALGLGDRAVDRADPAPGEGRPVTARAADRPRSPASPRCCSAARRSARASACATGSGDRRPVFDPRSAGEGEQDQAVIKQDERKTAGHRADDPGRGGG